MYNKWDFNGGVIMLKNCTEKGKEKVEKAIKIKSLKSETETLWTYSENQEVINLFFFLCICTTKE